MILSLFGLALGLTAPARAATQTIGVASAVSGPVQATAPDAVGRVLETGRAVYVNDHVATGATGKLQVLFKDETSFTLGPNSDMVLDDFVYDPNTSVGKVSATIAKGVFRFVTGKVARRDPTRMQVKTGMGTIGIRGTMVAGTVGPTEATILLVGPGRANNADERAGGIHVGNERGFVDIDRSGYATILKLGEAPSKPFELRGAALDAILNGVASSPSGENRGGAKGNPSRASGDALARGRYYEAASYDMLGEAIPETLTYAEQLGGQSLEFPDGNAVWAQVIKGVNFGTAQYNGTGTFSGGGPGTGTYTVSLNINFSADTIGGGGSNISRNGSLPGTFPISATPYESLSGNANLNILGNISGLGNYFTSATLQLVNSGGIPAKVAVITAAFNTGGGASATGVVNATR